MRCICSGDNSLCATNFCHTARFDVLRKGRDKYCVGVVAKVEFTGESKRILFHFPKTKAEFDEWIDFGSERIAELNTIAVPPIPKKDRVACRRTFPSLSPDEEKNFTKEGKFSFPGSTHQA